MKKMMTLILIFSCGAIPLFGGVIEKEVSFPIEEFTMEKFSTYDVVYLDGATSTMDIGAPMLPKITVKLLIPPSATATNVEILSYDTYELEGVYDIVPVQQPWTFSANSPPPVIPPDPQIYGSSVAYPGKLVSEEIHNGTKCGYRIASFQLYPLQYIPSEKRLVLHTNVRFRLHYEEGRYPVRSVTEKQKEVFGASVKRLVMNDEDLGRCTPPQHVARGPYGDWEMVIIAPNSSSMIDSIQMVADWKIKKGVPCMVKNVQDIYNDYSGGNPWRIKQFIDDMVSDSGTIWVFLFGDSAYRAADGIAAQGVRIWAGTSGYNDAPVDRYYEDLDNNWNHDNDSRYGEHTDGPGGGELDWYADCFVGRVCPPASAGSAGRYARRILWFEQSPDADFVTRAIFSSCELFSSSSHGYARTDDMASYCPGAWYMPAESNGHPGFEYQQGCNDYPGDATFLSTHLSSGYQFYGTSAHGSYNVFMADYYTTSITTSEISSYFAPADWTERCGIFTANSCLWGGFDQSDCCAEFLYHYGMTGGACNSREGWGYDTDNLPYIHYLSDGICWQFFVQIFNNDVYHLGEAVAEVKDYFGGDIDDDYWNWCLKEYNTWGDPELNLWTKSTAPLSLSATHASVVSNIPGDFDVNVTDGTKAPVSNVLVCLSCKTETSMYATGTTNGAGNVSIAVNPSIVGDTMWVTATKHNYIPYQGYAIVMNLAVSMSEFSAVGLKGMVRLSWRTECENDNVCWLIERSDDSQIEWVSVASLPGQGNKTSPTDYEYVDGGMEHDGRYHYRLISVDGNGVREQFGPISVTVLGKRPTTFVLHDAYPNPTSDKVCLSFDVPRQCSVSLRVYNSAGQVVKTMVEGGLVPGFYTVTWEGDDDTGRKIGHGVYFVRLNAEGFEKTTKVLLIR
jgi:hypothetical protein